MAGVGEVEPLDRKSILAWRRERRVEHMERRMALPLEAHQAKSTALYEQLADRFSELADGLTGFYWPFRREWSPFPFVERLIAGGGRLALPVVVEKGRPLEFRLWKPGDRMARGVYDIPFPAEGAAVTPRALIIPLLGFDEAGYRLGYGAGYYDRTLASFPEKPLAVGVGFELARMETIHPLPHDIPMDYIVTEAGLWERTPKGLETV
jgi:5-formyltetrahydrofolate cyclo-ligase